ncbi:hypothetical protein [Mangrovivirga cuniculi]|uniref:ABC transporter permease n=1 Tax=Mangrovivirga cuniculi TaxID=2715131 RepID=A0A4D7JU63_9BACT|nr:hypothetical protein [Mangrovivirga cuniculi]QCK15716.1 hypothetical protein DCC35_13665 [Mangrovivirga cuniculi]
MLFTIAWKNIWRNKVRSLVVIIAVMLGMWAGSFILAYMYGMIDQRLQDAIGNEVSHLQIHHPDFDRDNDPKYFIKKAKTFWPRSPEMRKSKISVEEYWLLEW